MYNNNDAVNQPLRRLDIVSRNSQTLVAVKHSQHVATEREAFMLVTTKPDNKISDCREERPLIAMFGVGQKLGEEPIERCGGRQFH